MSAVTVLVLCVVAAAPLLARSAIDVVVVTMRRRRGLIVCARPRRLSERWGPVVRVAGAGERLRARVDGSSARRDDQLRQLLERIGWGLRSGASLTRSLREAAVQLDAPLGIELAPCVAAIDDGQPLGWSLARWDDATPGSTRSLVVAALLVAAEAGGAAADALDGVAATVRDRQAVAREARALTTQARVSALVIVLAPLVFGMALAVGDRQVWQFLVDDPVGRACLASGLVLDVVGAWWMHRIAEGVDR